MHLLLKVIHIEKVKHMSDVALIDRRWHACRFVFCTSHGGNVEAAKYVLSHNPFWEKLVWLHVISIHQHECMNLIHHQVRILCTEKTRKRTHYSWNSGFRSLTWHRLVRCLQWHDWLIIMFKKNYQLPQIVHEWCTKLLLFFSFSVSSVLSSILNH